MIDELFHWDIEDIHQWPIMQMNKLVQASILELLVPGSAVFSNLLIA